ncbi:threonine/serine exporter ThrE family protein [Cellulomonas sp. 179-A 4D5 NHS]|uniref:threonine/serine ThrE exporter family protein n=1 Tax=Cellulomonas sp. 179-A 4D5 NHS TaxID=3142378 RepID=UPI00399FF597
MVDRGRRRLARAGAAVARRLSPPPGERPQVAEQPPEEVLGLLRRLGAAMQQAGDAADRVTMILDDVAGTYAASGVSFFVLPTGVFVRIKAGDSTRVDFAPIPRAALRLDQVDALYRLVDDIRHAKLTASEASARLGRVLSAEALFPAWLRVAGTSVMTLGLGLLLNPTASALPAYVVLGALLGVLNLWAERSPGIAVVLPMLAASVVSWLAFTFAEPVLGAAPLDIVIPSLVTLLPGAALTVATIELASGSIMSGSSRLVYGLERLLLLTFGIALGVEVAGLPGSPAGSVPLGAWAPWAGVLVFGLGVFLAFSVPPRALPWLLAVLTVAYTVQAGAGLVLGSLGASFAAGVVVLPVAYAIQQRPSGPPVPLTFLPAFWLLVPGALGLQGVAEIIGADAATGLGDFLNALLTVVAIAAGVLVGSGLSERVGRATGGWRGL